MALQELDEREIAALGRCARVSRTRYRAGEPLFRAGDRSFKFFVVESGEVARDEPARRLRRR